MFKTIITMKEKIEEERSRVFVIVLGVFLTIISLVTFYNFYRVILLQNEVQDLKVKLYSCAVPQIQPEQNTFSEEHAHMARKTKRSIVGATKDGVLVSSESYSQRKRQNLTERYPGYKGVSVSYMPAQSSYFGGYTSGNTITPNEKGGAPKKSQVNVRTSRVMHFEDKSKAFRQVVKLSDLKSMDTSSYASSEYNTGSSESEFPVIRDEGVVRKRTRQKMDILDERHPRTGRVKPLPTIHFGGDTSRYVLGTHENFNGNGHLRHAQRTFVDWKPSNWVEKTGMNSHFTFQNGHLTVKESGIYFIYAQIYYLDEHDRNGYRVYKNGESILQCTVSSHSSGRVQKGNTCYTAGVEYVAEGDIISLGDLSDGRYSLFEPGKSFFGTIKLGDIKARV